MGNWIQSELEILKRIASSKLMLRHTIHFALDYPFSQREDGFFHGVLISINLLRAELKLSPDRKPGDIDLLIVPFRGEQFFADSAIALEAKILRPTVKSPAKNANTMGSTQAIGLLDDGFPFVGLLHISMPQPLPAEMCRSIPIMSWTLSESGEYLLHDPFPIQSANRQEGRLHKLDLPDEIAFSAIAMTLSKDGERIIGNTISNCRSGLRNSHTSTKLVKSIENLVINKPYLFTEIRWRE